MSSAMVLGDNIFGHGLPEVLAAADAQMDGATVFGYHVSDLKFMALSLLMKMALLKASWKNLLFRPQTTL